MSFWFWLTTIYEVMWWFLPLEAAQTFAALYAVSVIIIFLILEVLAPTDETTYVPRTRRRHSNRLHTAFIGLMSRFGKSVEAIINNLKVRRRYHPPRLRYTGQRSRRKKGKQFIHTDLTLQDDNDVGKWAKRVLTIFRLGFPNFDAGRRRLRMHHE